MKMFQEAINKVPTLDKRESLSIFRRNLDPGQNERCILEIINKEPQSLVSCSCHSRLVYQRIKYPPSHEDEKQGTRTIYGKRVQTDRQANVVQNSETSNQSRNNNSRGRINDYRRNSDRRDNDRRGSYRREDSRRDYLRRYNPKEERPMKSEPRPDGPHWIPLNRLRADILKEVKGKPFFQPPKLMLTGLDHLSIN